MAVQFGKTWWGNEWLKALTHIDFANRIPRGASYARQGAVRSIEVKDGVITARVSGRRPTPYKVTIRVPQFPASVIKRLMEKLLTQPSLIAKLLNRELDPEVQTMAKSIGLQVFPQRWSDLDMQCSCPDWAVPCKHLAAVIYMMSREIDNDPFLVFTMHGLDLLEELRKRNVTIDRQELMEVPPMASLLEKKADTAEPSAYADYHFQRLDFSHLQNLTSALPELLPKEPVFYPKGDFQLKYVTEITRMAREAERILHGKRDLSTMLMVLPKGEIRRDDVVGLTMNANLIVDQAYIFTGKAYDHHQPYNDELLVALMQLPEDYLPDYDPTIASLHQAMLCALQLLAHGAIVPQIVRLDSGSYAVRWLPAKLDREVAHLMEQFETLLPPMLLQAKFGKSKLAKPVQHQAEHLLTYLFSRLIPKLSAKVNDDPIHALFFKNQTLHFDHVGETAIPGSIRSWTDRFFLSERQFIPSLLIDEEERGFCMDVAVEMEGQQVRLKEILSHTDYESQRFAILRELSLLSSLIPGQEFYINSGCQQPIRFTMAEFASFLLSTIPAIRLLGVKVMLPRALQELIRPKVSMRLSKKQADGKTYLRLDDMLQFNWQVAIGDELLSEEEFRRLLGHANGLIRFRQQYIYLSESDIQRLNKVLAGDHPVTTAQMLQAALAEEYGGARVSLSDEARQLIRQLTEQADIPVPAAIQAKLRPYQERGYSWMYRNLRIGFGSIIADDMGLGKTLQVITLLQRIKDDGALSGGKRLIIVVPTGLITNWQAELHRFAPALTVHVYHGPQRTLKPFTESTSVSRPEVLSAGTPIGSLSESNPNGSPAESIPTGPPDILLTTYGVLRSDVSQLKKLKWLIAVIDEAQNIKNADTAQSKALRAIPADTHIAMSGTPVENRLSEFWSIMDFVNHGYLGTAKSFAEDYAKPIQRQGDKRVANHFRRITAPFMLRRLKTDKSIISDLPDKVEQNELALLTERQAALYHETLEHAMQAIEAIDGTDSQSLFKRQGLVLQMILALKQICNHPALFLKNGICTPELSGKTEMLLSLLASIVDSGQKVLVFTQFREMGEMLQTIIEQSTGERPLFLHGGCSIKERQQMVDLFQNNPRTGHIFLLSLKAGGTGLNLTAASHVIHYDLWWNPAVEAQATDRAYRIGQHQNVVVHRFITQNTFEERIDQMIQDKRHLADMTVQAGESWIGHLSNRELREIFK